MGHKTKMMKDMTSNKGAMKRMMKNMNLDQLDDVDISKFKDLK